ncbi:MAG: 3'-5' exonuclease [Oscillospiraceae bacterium]|nr:3'-5' exonuclease [Oscillospiraceae bacterium]
MKRYIAFDVETPNRWNNRMSAIGISVIEDGAIVRDFYSLVDPEQPFDAFNTVLTGISAETVAEAPTFAELWPTIEPILSSGVLAAHNAPFDIGVLRKCLAAYGIAWRPAVAGLCTVAMGRRLLPGIGHRLNELCDYYGIALDHHRADSDSRACAEILLRYMAAGAEPEKFCRIYRMC